MCSVRILVSVAFPRVMAAAINRVAVDRSGITVCSTPRASRRLRSEKRGPQPLNAGPHRGEQVAQVDDFRFAGGRLDGRGSFRQDRGRHHVAGSRHVLPNGPARSSRAPRSRDGVCDHVARRSDLGPEPPVLSDAGRWADSRYLSRRGVKRTPVLGLAKRSQHAEAGPHPADQFVIGNVRPLVDNAERKLIVVAAGVMCMPSVFKQGRQCVDINEPRDAAEDRFAVGGQGGGHQGEGGVFRPADRDRAAKGPSAFDDEHVHPWTLGFSPAKKNCENDP